MIESEGGYELYSGMFYLVILIMLVAAIALVWWAIVEIRNRQRYRQVLEAVTLLVLVPREVERTEQEEAGPPKDFRELMSVAEQFFASLGSLYERNWLQRLKGQDRLGFEIVTQSGQILFYVSCSKRRKELVEKQILSCYPHAHVELVAGHNIFNVPEGQVAAGTLKLSKRFIFPIRTYKTLESDPLNAITNALSKLGEGANAAIQILLEPTSERWRTQCGVSSRMIAEGKGHYASLSTSGRVTQQTFEAIGTAMKNSSSPQQQAGMAQEERDKRMARLTPQQEEMMKMFHEKGAKVGFRTIVRVVAVAPDEETAKMHRDNILAAFGQYNWLQGNGFIPVIKRQSVLVTDFVLKLFRHAPIMILNAEELASLFHLPNRNTETPNLRWLHSRILPPPVNVATDGMVIGKSVYRGEEKLIRITNDDRRRHLFMIGKTGVGKTTFFENMIIQDIKNGAGLCFIDPLGDAVESILQRIPKERADDVVLFDPSDTEYPKGLNLLEFKNPEERDFLIQEVIAIFYKLFDPNQQGIVGPQWEHWARNAMLTLMSDPEGGTLIEIPRLFTDDEFRKKKISYVTDPVVKAFWEQQLAKTADFHKSEMYNYFISKFGRFMTNELMRNIIGQKQSAFNMRELMDSGKILLINLAKGKIGEINSNLLGMILVSKMQVAAFSRADIPEEKRRDFYLYVDEFQNFTTDTFATILSEARKYRLCLNITNQYIAQLTEKIRDAVIGNVGTIVAYRIGAADAEFLEKELPGVSVSDMTSLDRFQVYVKLLINLTPSKPFSMQGLKTEEPADGRLGEELRQLSRLKFGRDRLAVESEILDKLPIETLVKSSSDSTYSSTT